VFADHEAGHGRRERGHGRARHRIRQKELLTVLTLTESAVQVIRTVTSQPDLSPQTGLRIATQAQPEEAGTLALAVTEGPQAGDEIVEEQGARVYLEPDAASILDEMTLDASVNEQGDVTFRLADKPA
jgi:Fe-S cluster assembly iron-binding protein IscA